MYKFYENKKILITGHTGFKGSWLTQILLNFKADIIGVSFMPEKSPNLFEALGLKDKVKNYFIDIRNYEDLKAVLAKEKPEIVFHLAAQAIVRDSYDDPLKTISTNVLGTANLLQAVKEVGGVKSLVIITTDKVYENKESQEPYKEHDSLGGYDPYSASKAAADIITNSYTQSFFNVKDFKIKHNTLVSIARAGNVIGGGDWADHRLIPDIIRSIYDKNEEIVSRNPQAIRPWQHVLEPLSGYLMLAEKLYNGRIEISGAWNFGPKNESFVTVEKLINDSIKILGKGLHKTKPDDSKHEANILKLDITKAENILGWKPQLNFADTLELTFNWYKNYYDKNEDSVEFTNKQIDIFFK
ncbi:MAG: CDP-glucose 4,6-dehydratase [Candidatus Paceibacterota bacterium]|jgi:CDP-glucose 4,6-dehydratase